MHADGLVDRIPRRRFERVLYLAFGIDVITGCLCIKAYGVAGGGFVLASEAPNRYHARRKQKPEEGATMIWQGRHWNR